MRKSNYDGWTSVQYEALIVALENIAGVEMEKAREMTLRYEQAIRITNSALNERANIASQLYAFGLMVDADHRVVPLIQKENDGTV